MNTTCKPKGKDSQIYHNMIENLKLGRICPRCIFEPTLMGLLGVLKQKIAYYTFKWLKTSKKGYFGPFFQNFSFFAVFVVGYVQDTYLGQ